jgi:hypothetical protein
MRKANLPGTGRDRRRNGHLAVCCGPRPRVVWRELRESGPRPTGLRVEGTDRGRVDHHALELPTSDRLAETPLCTGCGLHMRREAERDDLSFDPSPRGSAGRGRTPSRGLQCGDGLRARCRRAHDDRPRCRHDLLHGLDRRLGVPQWRQAPRRSRKCRWNLAAKTRN